MADVRPLQQLTDEQIEASAPHADVWLSASAGTGKTQVLSARVLRLLLSGAKPESILCLTFTKAGAAEMAERIHSRLAVWVRAPDKLIMRDLFHLGERNDAVQIEHARTLFATVLDARGGGLRIQTIHSFCQTLLSGFPAEAGLSPGFRPMEERESTHLAQIVLGDMVSDALTNGDSALINHLQTLALLKGEDGARAYLSACARAHRALAALGSGIDAKVRLELGLPLADVLPFIHARCSDGGFDRADLDQIVHANVNWGTATGLKRADIVADWLRVDPLKRADSLDLLVQIWTKQDGERRSIEKKLEQAHPEYAEITARAFVHFNALIELRRLDALATQVSNALILGQHYAAAFAEAKRKAGGVDFDDLIHITVRLLREPGIGAWIRYKLDQSTDHVLIDEAQDTNNGQWEIIKALAEEFYAGEGAKSGARRTIFTVGDTKQAIFGFQGADPRAMATARQWFDILARGVERTLLDLNLQQSYRASPPILALVDAVIGELGPEAMGLDARETLHRAALGSAGHVTLLPPMIGDEDDTGNTTKEESWITPATHSLARSIARQVSDMLTDGVWIEDRTAKPPTSRRLQPKDIMILLRSRGALAQLIVARLHEAKVPVAGIDRLRLTAPLVVRDVMAAIRFALQPLDDLNLACLLVSPLFGWSQEDVQRVAIAREKRNLWPYLRATEAEDRLASLYHILSMGDRHAPARFIENLLSGPIKGRFKLIERFGEEARDPLDELMNAALAFKQLEGSSLQGFLNWFELGDIDIKRDADAKSDAVRVLTVHGAKGLQAPVVILADAAGDPEKKQDRQLNWMLDAADVPIPRPAKADRLGTIGAAAEAAARLDLEEHYRLLYVALTRAEERLIIAGALGKNQNLSELSWHAVVGRALATLGGAADDDGVVMFGEAAKANTTKALPPATVSPMERPDWLDTPAPIEARPPRPLAPSALTDDTSTDPPPSTELLAAAQRGRLMHALFERLPDVAPAERVAAAERWLCDSAGVTNANERVALIADALRVIGDPSFADYFSGSALAEAPIAGVVDGVVIAGSVDRLLVDDQRVLVIDFKTARRVPASSERLPEAHLRQMAAYVAVLQSIFPTYEVRAALLYTSGPKLFTLTDAEMEAHKPSYQLEQQLLAEGA